ncbi:hypothetical protein [Kribbella deserti]|uniref:Restriction system protein n=1 Tax=Kribbella deserti TaxID=1926257 RepID=A0ABV6QSF0_9ACTN
MTTGSNARGAREADRVRERQAEAQAGTAEVEERTATLGKILAGSLRKPVRIPFAALRRQPALRPFEPGPDEQPEEPPRWADYAVPEPSGWRRLLRAKEIEARRNAAHARFAADEAAYHRREKERAFRVRQRRNRHAVEMAVLRRRAEAENARIDELEVGYRVGQPDAVREYAGLVLSHRRLPAGVPAKVDVRYQPESSRLSVVFDLPGPGVIPAIAGYRYVRTRDTIEERVRPLKDRKQLYADLVAQLVLVRLHDAFATCSGDLVTEVAVAALVPIRDRTTGWPARPCLASVVATRTRFSELPLANLDPGEALEQLGARLSPRPFDLYPTRPFFDPERVRHHH